MEPRGNLERYSPRRSDDATVIAFLWYNVIGCVVVVAAEMSLSLFDGKEG